MLTTTTKTEVTDNKDNNFYDPERNRTKLMNK